jgi:hypothetical protein
MVVSATEEGTMPVREMVTISEAAERLGVTRQRVHKKLETLDVYTEAYGAAEGRVAAFYLVDYLELHAKWSPASEPDAEAVE